MHHLIVGHEFKITFGFANHGANLLKEVERGREPDTNYPLTRYSHDNSPDIQLARRRLQHVAEVRLYRLQLALSDSVFKAQQQILQPGSCREAYFFHLVIMACIKSVKSRNPFQIAGKYII